MATKQCLDGFRSVGEDKCVFPCPQGFSMITENNTYKCVHTQDKRYSVILNPVGATAEDISVGGMLAFRRTNPSLYESYLSERTRVTNEIETINRNFPKEQQLENAFKDLQNAENIRDVDPQGYQTARMNYYTLLKGETWRDTEKERLTKIEIEPLVTRYRTDIESNLQQIQDQTTTIDAAKGVKDKVLSIKDEIQYSTSTFQNQLNKLRDAITLEYKKNQQKKETNTSWLGLILNGIIILLLISATVIVWKKYFPESAYTSTPSTTVKK